MAPTAGLSDQVTPGAPLVTVAVNCWAREVPRVTEVGLTATMTGGCRVTVAEADLLVATIVAVRITFWGTSIVAGAVKMYNSPPSPLAGSGLGSGVRTFSSGKLILAGAICTRPL